LFYHYGVAVSEDLIGETVSVRRWQVRD